MLSLAVFGAVAPLCVVVWKALDTVQRLAVLAAAATPQERREAFTAATPVKKPVLPARETESPVPAQTLVGLGPDV